MTDAPEKIWASGFNSQPSGRWWHETELKQGQAYRRADLPPTLSDALKVPEVRALVDVLERVIADPHWRTTDNTLWPDMCKAVAAFKAMEAGEC